MPEHNVHPIRPTGPMKGGVAGDGNGPHDGDMEARVAKLEVELDYIKRDVAETRTDMKAAVLRLGSIDASLATINQKLDTFPTKLQLSLWAGGCLLAVLAVAASLIALLLKLSGHQDAADAVDRMRGK